MPVIQAISREMKSRASPALEISWANKIMNLNISFGYFLILWPELPGEGPCMLIKSLNAFVHILNRPFK